MLCPSSGGSPFDVWNLEFLWSLDVGVWNLIFASRKFGFGRAVSRILSAPLARRRESFVSATYTRNLSRFHGTRSGQLLGFQFGLAPDGVFRAVSLALHAVRSYRTFSPSPPACAGWLSVFCGTVRQSVLKRTACVYPNRTDLGYAASRPMEFGLSSPSLRLERFSALPKPTGY